MAAMNLEERIASLEEEMREVKSLLKTAMTPSNPGGNDTLEYSKTILCLMQ